MFKNHQEEGGKKPPSHHLSSELWAAYFSSTWPKVLERTPFGEDGTWHGEVPDTGGMNRKKDWAQRKQLPPKSDFSGSNREKGNKTIMHSHWKLALSLKIGSWSERTRKNVLSAWIGAVQTSGSADTVQDRIRLKPKWEWEGKWGPDKDRQVVFKKMRG